MYFIVFFFLSVFFFFFLFFLFFSSRISFEKEEDQKNNIINELTNKLKHLKKITNLSVKYEQQTSIAQAETIARLRNDYLKKLNIDIEKNKINYKTDKRVNKRTLNFLSKQKDQMDKVNKKYNIFLFIFILCL
jgi:hypothetical protein